MFKQMIGNRYLYNAKEYLIEDTSWSGDYLLVKTDKKTFHIHKDNEKKTAEEFLPISNELTVKDKALQVATQANTLKTVTDILVDCIKKVNEDPSYIKQANSINGTVRTITGVMKIELEMLKYKQK